MSNLPLLSNTHARLTFLDRQGLLRPPHLKQTPDDLLDLIQTIGFVQVDSISTVERAHHMILYARNQTYRPHHLPPLLEQDRSLFEHWTHDASIIPMDLYPMWRHRFAREKERLKDRWIKWRREGFLDALDEVEQHITDHGPTMSRDLLKDEHRKSKGATQGWWDWHPSKTALEYLWRTGVLAIDKRVGFQKVYDLSPRTVPPKTYKKTTPKKVDDFIDWACRSALDRLGFATPGEIAGFWGLISPAEAKAWSTSKRAATLQNILVEAADGSAPKQALAAPDLFERLDDLPDAPKRIRVLSPFDPVLRDRKRAKRLFNYDYRIEIFVPEKKRTYGYYVFPLMEGDKMIGRIDMKKNSATAVLEVKALWLEPKIKLTPARKNRLEAELERVRRFCGAQTIEMANNFLKS